MRLRTRDTTSSGGTETVPEPRGRKASRQTAKSTKPSARSTRANPAVSTKEGPKKIKSGIVIARSRNARAIKKDSSPAVQEEVPSERAESEYEIQDVLQDASLPPSPSAPQTLSTVAGDSAMVDKQITSATTRSKVLSEFFLGGEPEEVVPVEEDVYRPDPSDPFGFGDAERKLKYRRLMLERQASEDATWKLSDDVEGSPAEPEAHPATPAGSILSRRRLSGEISSPQSPEDASPLAPKPTPKTSRRREPKEEKKLTTMELEMLLPKRKRGKAFISRKKAGGKENTDGKPKRRAGKIEKAAKEEETEEIDMSEVDLKERRERKALFEALDDYSLETETVIWL